MQSRRNLPTLILLLCVVFPATSARGSPIGPASLSETIGADIDSMERDRYHLFPDIRGFESARLVRLENGAYRLEFVARGASGSTTKSRRISAEAFEQTRLHVALTEAYLRQPAIAGPDSANEAELLHRLSLRYASQARYDIASVLAEDLRGAFPETDHGRWASETAPQMEFLVKRRRAFIWPGALLDQRGRTDLLVFSGYYGLWLGVAIPVVFESESAQAYAAGLLLAPPICIVAANAATKEANIPQGQATIISLGGRLGTWQGIGWSAMSDADGNTTVGAGVLAGLGGIAAAIPVAKAGGFSEGHAAIMNSALYWGSWFGAVFGVLANHDETQDHGILPDMLIASDTAILGAGIAARNVRLSKGRMRLINLAGVLGTAMGFGVDLLFEVDNEEPVFAIAGAGSIAGLAIGSAMTRRYDQGKDLAMAHAANPVVATSPAAPRPTLRAPLFSVRNSAGAGGRPIPAVSIRIDF